MKVRTGFVAINYECFAIWQIEANGFFIAKDVSAMRTQPLHADNDVESFYGDWHKVYWERIVV